MTTGLVSTAQKKTEVDLFLESEAGQTNKVVSLVTAYLPLLVSTWNRDAYRYDYSGELMQWEVPCRAVWLQAQMAWETSFDHGTAPDHCKRYAAITGESLTVGESLKYFLSFGSLQQLYINRIFLPLPSSRNRFSLSTQDLERLRDIPKAIFENLISDELPSVFRICRQTTDLTIDGQSFSGGFRLDLAPFAELSKLRTLRLKWLENIPKNIGALRQLPHLTTLDLSFCGCKEHCRHDQTLTQSEKAELSVIEQMPHLTGYGKAPGYKFNWCVDNNPYTIFAREKAARCASRNLLALYDRNLQEVFCKLAQRKPEIARTVCTFLTPEELGDFAPRIYPQQLSELVTLSTENLSKLTRYHAQINSVKDSEHLSIKNLAHFFGQCSSLTELSIDLAALQRQQAANVIYGCVASSRKIVSLTLENTPQDQTIQNALLPAIARLPLTRLAFRNFILSRDAFLWINSLSSLNTFACTDFPDYYLRPLRVLGAKKLMRIDTKWIDKPRFECMERQGLCKTTRTWEQFSKEWDQIQAGLFMKRLVAEEGVDKAALDLFCEQQSLAAKKDLLYILSGDSTIAPSAREHAMKCLKATLKQSVSRI